MHFSTTLIALVAALSPILEVSAAPYTTTTTSKSSSTSVKATSTSSIKTTSTTSIKTTSTSTKASSTTSSSAQATQSSGIQPYSSKLQRKEWRAMTKTEQIAYLSAVQCLQTKPAPSNLRGAKTLYDYFAATHLDLVDTPQGDTIHIVAQFLPWHRYFLYIYESNLRSKCGYSGAQPYWNWSLDANALSKSPVFDATYGFGGNGTAPKQIVYPYTGNITFIPPAPGVIRPTGNCITTGPFKNYTLNVGPGNFTVPHCLARNIQDNTMYESLNANAINTCTSMTNFQDMWLCIELGIGLPGNDDFHLNGPHAALHISVGEEMMNMASSPGDPLFFMHHANLDRIWAQWQLKNATARTYDFSGSSNQERTANATLNTPLYMQGLAADGIVRWTMNTSALNYEYI